MIRHWVRFAIFAFAAHAFPPFGEPAAFAESKAEFKRTLALELTEHIILDVTAPKGDVNISFRHAGEISVAVTAATGGKDLPPDFFDTSLTVEQEGMHVKIRSKPNAAYSDPTLRMSYSIGVPDWIEVNSTVDNGKQTVAGVRGPVKLVSGSGDIKVSYITASLEAKTGAGNIDVVRVGSFAKVETGTGNIRMKDIGPASVAIVQKGIGRIEMDGISGTFTGSTDAGDLDAGGGVFDDWDLKSVSGNIRVRVANESKFNLDAATHRGILSIESQEDDLEECRKAPEARECRQKVNGGGKLVHVRSESGNIVIQ